MPSCVSRTRAFTGYIVHRTVVGIDAGDFSLHKAYGVCRQRRGQIHPQAQLRIAVLEHFRRNVGDVQQVVLPVDHRNIDSIAAVLADFLGAAKAGAISAQHDDVWSVVHGKFPFLMRNRCMARIMFA
jgi:hypothetical protein